MAGQEPPVILGSLLHLAPTSLSSTASPEDHPPPSYIVAIYTPRSPRLPSHSGKSSLSLSWLVHNRQALLAELETAEKEPCGLLSSTPYRPYHNINLGTRRSP